MEPSKRRLALQGARLYLCTDARLATGDLAQFADRVLGAGVDIIQLRHKNLEARQELAALAVLREACERHDALLAVNDRADLALAAGADILHLGQDDLPVNVARQILGDDVLIGRSTHDRDQALEAISLPGIDYFCTGPVWSTPTKPGRPATGLELVRVAAAEHPARVWFAIGGIDQTTIDDVLAAGASRIVVVRAITAAPDPAAASAALAGRLRQPR